MKLVLRTAFTLLLTAVLATSVMADDETKKKQKGKKGAKKGRRAASVAQFIGSVRESLTEDQKVKIKELDKEYGPKLAEMRKARNEVISPELRKKIAEARKGKKGKEARAAGAALYTDEHKAKLKELTKKNSGLRKEIRDKVIALLTDEQKAKLPKGGNRKKPTDGKKPTKKKRTKKTDKKETDKKTDK